MEVIRYGRSDGQARKHSLYYLLAVLFVDVVEQIGRGERLQQGPEVSFSALLLHLSLQLLGAAVSCLLRTQATHSRSKLNPCTITPSFLCTFDKSVLCCIGVTASDLRLHYTVHCGHARYKRNVSIILLLHCVLKQLMEYLLVRMIFSFKSLLIDVKSFQSIRVRYHCVIIRWRSDRRRKPRRGGSKLRSRCWSRSI